MTFRDFVLLAAFAASAWMRQGFPVLGLGSGEYDDMLFVRMAAHLSGGHWLGAYGNLTLAKGMGYPALIAISHAAGLPLKLTEQLLYLAAALLFSLTFARLLGSRWAAVLLFVVLAFDPAMWAPEVGGRVVRENLYASLSLGLVAAALRLYVVPLREAGAIAPKAGWLLLFGIGGGWFWLTREEGLWLAPALAVPLAAWAMHWARRGGLARRGARMLSRWLVLPLLGFGAVVGLVDSLNLAAYGVFRNNDFRSADFQAAYGALSRISQDRWRRYVVFPKDARERAYRVSAAARELRPSFEGEPGAFWTRVSCEQTHATGCDEILSGWFMWALRDAVARAGHYASAPESQRFYRELAAEIDRACEAGEIPCGDRHHTLVPPWHAEYLPWTLDASRAIVRTLLGIEGIGIHAIASIGNAEELGLMTRMIGAPVSPSDALPETARVRFARHVLAWQRAHLRYVLPAALALWILAVAFRSRALAPGVNVAMLALLAAVGARVALLGFLDATSIPSNNLLYLSPALPAALALSPCALAIALSAFRKQAAR